MKSSPPQSQKKKQNQLPLIKLIGDPEENFYQLGLIDRENFLPVHTHLENLIKTPWASINKIIKELGGLYLAKGPKHCPYFYKNVSAYAEGLGIKYQQLALTLLVPEYLSCLTKWLPGVKSSMLGCSSYFYWDETYKAPIHGRILDFPLAGSFNQFERAILYQFNKGPKIASLSTAGFPYPALTSMTEEGLTFALHQKFTDTFNAKGTPIFELVFQLLSKTGDKKSIINFLKKSRSITTWSFYISCKNGDVLAVDMMGTDLYINEYHLADTPFLYFNNMPESPLSKKKAQQYQFLPHGVSDYCAMRTELATVKIEKLKKQALKEKKLNEEFFLKTIATPVLKKTKSPSKWKLNPITISSLSISTMNAHHGKILTIPTSTSLGPKFFTGKINQMSHLWNEAQCAQSEMAVNGPITPKNYQLGMGELMAAQTCFDNGDKAHIYHHLQMAQDYLEAYPEGTIAAFYFLVFQYIFEGHHKIRAHLHSEFEQLKGKLPPYLGEHNLLFINRLEIILKYKRTITKNDFHIVPLKNIWRGEEKIPPFLLHKITAPLINPRIDILDIIYIHIRS